MKSGWARRGHYQAVHQFIPVVVPEQIRQICLTQHEKKSSQVESCCIFGRMRFGSFERRDQYMDKDHFTFHIIYYYIYIECIDLK